MHPDLITNTEKRNENLANQAFNALQNGEKAFFAPRIMHYIGEKGIFNLLEQKNVKITRIPLD